MPRRPLYDVATAFAGLATVWQAVLWHRGVEHAPGSRVDAAAGGTFTAVRPPSTDEAGDGSWTLIVITEAPAGDPAPRRLFVVIRPDQGIVANGPLQVDVPIGGSGQPAIEQRLVSVIL